MRVGVSHSGLPGMSNSNSNDVKIGRKLLMLNRPHLRLRLARLHTAQLDEMLADYALASRMVRSLSAEYTVLCVELADEIERAVDQL